MSEKDTVSEVTPEESSATTPEKKKKSRESLFGGLLFGVMIIFILMVLAGIGWAVWGGVSYNQAENQELSISALGEIVEAVKEEVTGETEPVPSAETATPAVSKSTAISVLNGGAVGGSAGKLVTAIKQDGYTAVTAGDATADYTGVVIYYAETVAKEAEALKTTVAKAYPNVTTAKALATTKETSTSPLTVIIGR